MAMKKVNCTLSVVCCVSLISMAIVMFVLYAQLLGEYQQLQHQYASISSQLNQTHDSTMIAELKVELTNLITNQKGQPNQTHDNKMIAELETQLTSLKGTSSELQQQNIRFSNKLKQSNKTITDQKIELTNLTANLNDELNKSNKKITELETQLTSLKGTSSELQQQDIRFSNELNQSNKKITDQKIELTNLTANHNDELNKSNKKITELETELTSLKGTSSELQQQNIRFSDELNQSNKKITDQKIELTNLTANHNDDLDKSNKKIADLEADLTNLNDELDQSKKMITELETQLTSLKGTSSELQQRNIRFSDGLNQSNKVIADMNVQLTNLNETQEFLKKFVPGGQSCQEILANGQTRNGVYMITGTGTPFGAYCKQGYMVFQRRFDGSTDFNQNFQTYVNGFGSLNGEYWLGLEKLYQFTKMGKHKLRVDLVAYDGDTAYAIYEDFSIGVGPGYQLHIGKYSGTAGDSLTYHNNMKFTTVDNDADTWSTNCAEDYKGAFWYKGCHRVNINAFNYHDKTATYGMRWQHFNNDIPNKETTMMVL